eukprot:2196368-Rhodomonas_salina.1
MKRSHMAASLFITSFHFCFLPLRLGTICLGTAARGGGASSGVTATGARAAGAVAPTEPS